MNIKNINIKNIKNIRNIKLIKNIKPFFKLVAAKILETVKKIKQLRPVDSKTTIKERIVRLSFLAVLISAVVLTVIFNITMYNYVISSAQNEVELLSSSYSSAISNADLDNSSKFLNNIFNEFDQSNQYNGFGFAITEQGAIFSGSESGIVAKGDNIVDAAEENEDYSELAEVIEALDRTTSHQTVKFLGVKYLCGWSLIEKYDTCYVMILLPYNNIMRNFQIAMVFIVIIAIAAVVCSAVISLRVANAITTPINGAIDRLRALSQGDLASPCPTGDRNDETLILLDSLGETITAFNIYINDIKNVLSSVADGNLIVRSEADYSGDFIAIKNALDRIITSLNKTFREVNKATVSVHNCSAQVSEGTAVLSKNSADEAETIRELTSSISRVTDVIITNANEAEQASEMTSEADRYAEIGSKNMSQMIKAISDIENSANEIEKIINVIDDIAFQTNILALNAAVEAARAGDAGKGFAVVADEVRNLAIKSSEAAAETGKLIAASVSSVRRGTELADETSQSLTKVVEKVGAVNSIISGIAVSSNEQANSVREIRKGMELVNGSIQHNSVTAEQNAGASKELADQFETLGNLIKKFSFKR